jgi:hypothetical protein
MSRDRYDKKDEWLDEAGFRSTLNGNIGRAVPSGYIVRFATVKLHRDAIIWRPDSVNATELAVSENLLGRFIKLWKSPNPDICAFARHWGILRLNASGRPLQSTTKGGSESLALWRFLSRRAYSVLRIAANLEQGKEGGVEDWRLLSNDSERIPYNFPTFPTGRSGLKTLDCRPLRAPKWPGAKPPCLVRLITGFLCWDSRYVRLSIPRIIGSWRFTTKARSLVLSGSKWHFCSHAHAICTPALLVEFHTSEKSGGPNRAKITSAKSAVCVRTGGVPMSGDGRKD